MKQKFPPLPKNGKKPHTLLFHQTIDTFNRACAFSSSNAFVILLRAKICSSRSNLHIAADAFRDRVFIRTSDLDSPRAMYICSPLVHDIIRANDPARIRLINCGVKAFTRQGNEEKKAMKAQSEATSVNADDIPMGTGAMEDEVATSVEDGKKERDLIFRFVYEGVEVVLPFVEPASILTAGLKDLRRMLEVYYPSITDFEESSFGPQIAAAGGLSLRFSEK